MAYIASESIPCKCRIFRADTLQFVLILILPANSPVLGQLWFWPIYYQLQHAACELLSLGNVITNRWNHWHHDSVFPVISQATDNIWTHAQLSWVLYHSKCSITPFVVILREGSYSSSQMKIPDVPRLCLALFPERSEVQVIVLCNF